METRKVQLSGGTTYTISLPKQWASEHDIEAGSLLYLHPDDDSLLLETVGNRARDERSDRIDVSNRDETTVLKTVHAAYLVGSDSITLFDHAGHPNGRRHAITSMVGSLSGLEVLEVTETTITIRNLISVDSISIRKSTLRLKLITLAMFRDAVDAVVTHDEELAAQVIDRDDEADKLCALVSRHFRRALTDLHEADRLGCSRVELFQYYRTARHLERIADHAEKMARLVERLDEPLPRSFADTYTERASAARHLLERACDAVYVDSKTTTAHGVFRDCETQMDELEAVSRELFEYDDSSVAYVVSLLVDSVFRTVSYTQNIAEVGVQQTLE